ncbi:hypothetical protein WN943_021881 [Citrus x changshan-huyou]
MKQRTFREFSHMQRKTSAEVQMHLDGEGITKNYPDEFMIILGFYVTAAKLAWSYDCFGHYFTERLSRFYSWINPCAHLAAMNAI